MAAHPRVGIDLDNTIICYDEILFRVAMERNLIPADIPRVKKVIREAIRKNPIGELQWQKIQGEIYGSRILEAQPMEGVADFLRHCRRKRIPVYVVSHKTAYAGYDSTRTNLRSAALCWLREQGFLEEKVFGLDASRIFFEPGRSEKITRIRQLKCTHFIDDLEELFLEVDFPQNVQKILLSANGRAEERSATMVFSSWPMITDYFSKLR